MKVSEQRLGKNWNDVTSLELMFLRLLFSYKVLKFLIKKEK